MDPMLATELSNRGRVDKVDDATAKVDDSGRREDSTQNISLCDGPSSREEKNVTSSQPGTSPDKIDHDIRQIDAVLKALNVGNFDISNALIQTSSQHVGEQPPVKAETTAATIHSTGLHLIGQLGSGDSGSSSDSDNSSSDSSDSSMRITRDLCRDVQSDEESTCARNGGQPNIPIGKGEVDYRTLPTEECEIPFPEGGTVMPMGKVSHLAEKLVIIEALPGTPPFNEGTIIWNEQKKSIARIFETFGPVKSPRYSVLVESSDHASSLGLAPGHLVYVIPSNMELTKYIFTKQLMKQKGSDASWKDDNEVPAQFQDYSDDESEQAAHSRKKQPGKRARQLRTCHTPLTSELDMSVNPTGTSTQSIGHLSSQVHHHYPADTPATDLGAHVDSNSGYGHLSGPYSMASHPSYSGGSYANTHIGHSAHH